MFQEDQVWWLCRRGTLTLGDIPTGCYLITAMSQVSDGVRTGALVTPLAAGCERPWLCLAGKNQVDAIAALKGGTAADEIPLA